MKPQNGAEEDNSGSEVADLSKRSSRKGQGKYSFGDYPEAPINNIEIEELAKGDICPCCNKGKLYDGEARKLLEFSASAPISVKRHKKKVLRCNTCNREFMNNKRIDKWTNSARSSIVLQKLNGMPFNRLSKLQSLYNIPIAKSTLWIQCLGLWNDCGKHIYQQLLDLASESTTFKIDDTRAKILEVIAANKELPKKERRACNTTAICTTVLNDNKPMVLYITADKYAGENIAPILNKRSNPNHYIRLIADASNQNIPHVDEELLRKIIIANCHAHGRRQFFELLNYYPDECQYFINEIGAIYKNENICKNYSDRKRLKYHKQNSSKHIKNIYAKIRYLFDNKLVEPNSELGKAMRYWLNHKSGLSKFLKIKGIKLDNNEVEQILRYIILQRKNSLFFKTKDSAEVLSGLSSLVKTCEINQINAFGYLNWIQEHWKEIQKNPKDYLPWRYQEYLNNTELIAA